MYAVAGDCDDALDQEDVLAIGFRERLEEDDHVASMHVAVRHEGCPTGWRRQGLALNQHVIAGEQSAGHGRGRDDEVLKQKRENKQHDYDGGQIRR